MSLLKVENLNVTFPIKRGLLGRSVGEVHAVNGVSFEIAPGETLGLVGESGCGKTTLGRAILRLIEPTSGNVTLDGKQLQELSQAELREQRRKFQMIFQDPFSSLNPRMVVEDIIGEAIDIHSLANDRKDRRGKVEKLLVSVGLEAAHADRYPHEFSGGQRQRIGIARALAVEPQLIICDEPVSALDVSVQAQIVNLLKDIQRTRGLAFLFIAHDLAVVQHISDRIMVMYLGQVMEMGDAAELCKEPKHPYTKALISAVPELNPETKTQRILLPGDVPSPIDPPTGCPFHPRCPIAEDRCKHEKPDLREITPGRHAACHLAEGEI